jgi:hypothetical protein
MLYHSLVNIKVTVPFTQVHCRKALPQPLVKVPEAETEAGMYALGWLETHVVPKPDSTHAPEESLAMRIQNIWFPICVGISRYWLEFWLAPVVCVRRLRLWVATYSSMLVNCWFAASLFMLRVDMLQA